MLLLSARAPCRRRARGDVLRSRDFAPILVFLQTNLTNAISVARVDKDSLAQPIPSTIRPAFDETADHWVDEDQERIEAHGAGLIQRQSDGRWFWYGESRKDIDAGAIYAGVNCYSSASLAGPWKNEGKVLQQSQITVPGFEPPFVLERPKVVFNEKTQKYVMWVHLDKRDDSLQLLAKQDGRLDGTYLQNSTGETSLAMSAISVKHTVKAGKRSKVYVLRSVGVAIADSPMGPFTFLRAFQPDGVPSLDMSLWVDDDRTAYLIRSCDNQYTAISKLTDDYLDTEGILSKGPRFEGMSMFRHTNGTLYMITSHLTGWQPNPLVLYRSDGQDLSDPQWVALNNPTQNEASFNTQPTYIVPYTTSSGARYHIYLADNWIHGGDNGLLDATYVWLPIRFHGNGKVYLDKLAEWSLENPFENIERAKPFCSALNEALAKPPDESACKAVSSGSPEIRGSSVQPLFLGIGLDYTGGNDGSQACDGKPCWQCVSTANVRLVIDRFCFARP